MKRLFKYAIAVIVFCEIVFCVGVDVNAAAVVPSSYGECESMSGGRMGIWSVWWACQTKFPNGGSPISSNVCSLWIGNDAEAKIDQITLPSNFKVTEDEYFAPIKYYGMCTNNAAEGTVRVCEVGTVTYVDGSQSSGGKRSCIEYKNIITQDATVSRGEWGAPGFGTDARLNVGEFLKIANVTSDNRGDWYKLPVDIFRCYGSSWWYSTVKDACSNMAQNITVLIPKAAQKYLGASSVSNRDSQTSGGGSDYATTGITDKEGSTANTPDITGKKVGDKVSLTFSHNVFTVLQASGVNWSVKRTVTKDGSSQDGFGGGENFDVETSRTGNSSGETGATTSGSGNTGTERSDNWLYYAVEPRSYSDGGNKYLLRDFYTVTFKKSGTYEFCEALTVNGKNLTKVCSKIIVSGGGGTGDEGFYTVSNVSNSKIGGYTTTGLNGGPLVEKSTDTIEVKVNDTVDVVFSHNIYADEKTNGVAWKVTREGLSGVTGVTISRQSGSGLTTSVSGVANLTVEENGKFAAENRLGSDGASKYLVREKYTLKFTRENSTGYKFCETIGLTINGSSRDYTKVCTTIKVKKDGGDDDPGGSKCGLWTPPSYTNSNSTTGTTSVVTKIYNDRLSGTYSGWRGEIDEGTSPATPVALDKRITYARPGDTVEWVSCYWPGVQKVANTTVTFKHAGHPLYLGSGNATNTNENYLFSNSIFGTWENKFNITTVGGISASPSSGTMLVGDSSAKESTTTHFVNATADVGKYFEETISGGYSPVWATTSLEEAAGYSWSCNPYRCSYSCPPCGKDGCSTCWTTCYYSCSHTNDYVEKDRKNGPVVSGPARVEIPYNFINETGVSVSPTASGVDVVYAGETINVNEPYVKVKDEKYNSLTEDSYATVVDNAQVRLIAYASAGPNGGERIIPGNTYDEICNIISDDLPGYCETVKQVNGKRLNNGGNLRGWSETSYILNEQFNGVYSVFDVDAGKQMCFVMAVYPYTSGEDNNLEDYGDKNWYISAPACKTVAKKPNVQVWGGGVFSVGDIQTNTSDKINIFGVEGYTAKNWSGRRVFGSWAEQAVIANGQVWGFASGAASGRLYPGDLLGGSPEGDVTSFCNNRVPLSFANLLQAGSAQAIYVSGICPGQEATGMMRMGVSTVNRQALVDYFTTGTKTGQRDGDYEKITSGTGKDIYVADVTSGNYVIGGRTLYANETRVVKVAGSATITGNIIYNDQYYSVYNVPKMVIYASGNINISCSVTRVDAILITMGTVVTCPGYSATDSSTWNADARTSQLIINGAVVANRIDFGRTYGNTIGYGSDDPAEAINYDTSSVLWGRSMADAGESDTLTVVYQRELAPRY